MQVKAVGDQDLRNGSDGGSSGLGWGRGGGGRSEPTSSGGKGAEGLRRAVGGAAERSQTPRRSPSGGGKANAISGEEGHGAIVRGGREGGGEPQSAYDGCERVQSEPPGELRRRGWGDLGEEGSRQPQGEKPQGEMPQSQPQQQLQQEGKDCLGGGMVTDIGIEMQTGQRETLPSPRAAEGVARTDHEQGCCREMALSLLLFSTSKSSLAAGCEDKVQEKMSWRPYWSWSSGFTNARSEIDLKRAASAVRNGESREVQNGKRHQSGKATTLQFSGVRRCVWRSNSKGGGSKVDGVERGAYIALLCMNLTLATLSCTLAAACDFYTHWGLHADAGPGPISAFFSWGAGISISNPGRAAVSRVAGLGSKGAAAVGAAVGTMGSVAGVAIGNAAAAASVTFAKAVVALFCAACLCVVVPLTHGLGGKLRYRHLPWTFWQPFVGGLRFIVMQAVAWSLFAAALVAFGTAAYCAIFVTGTAIDQGLMASAGFSGLASEILLALSLVCFQPSSQGEGAEVTAVAPAAPAEVMTVAAVTPTLPPADLVAMWHQATGDDATASVDRTETIRKEEIEDLFNIGGVTADYVTEVVYPRHWRKELLGAALRGPWRMESLCARDYLTWAFLRVKCWGSLLLLYCPHYLFVSVIFLPVMLLPPTLSVPFLALLFALYFPTYLGQPQRTDRRTWEASKSFFIGLLEEASVCHFSGLRIVRDSRDPFPSNGRYVFAYHPHGIYPATMSWFHLTEAWKKLFPGITPVALAASAVFYVPILRDLVLWVGTQEVSRKVFRSTLRKKNAVFLCPGGQSELAYHCPREQKQVVLCSRKRGFIREAMEAGASLVPVFCFGEAFALRNFFNWPSAQRFTYRRLGFPVPFMPVGVAGVLPLPCQEQIAIIVGKPIPTIPEDEVNEATSSNSENGLSEDRKASATEKRDCDTCVRRFTEADVERMRRKYFQALQELFEKYKDQYGYDDVQLVLRE